MTASIEAEAGPENILYEVADGVATITFNRPAALNALLPEMGDQLATLVERADADPAVRVMVLTGAGKAFSSGADLKLMGRSDRLGRTALVGRERNRHGSSIVARMLQRDKPLIASVNGVVAGMACAYVLCADFALGSDQARFVFGFTRLGFVPDCGLTYLLPQRVGLAQAQRITLTAEPVGAAEALRIGLLTEVVAADQLASQTAAVAASVAARAPHAVRLTRSLLARSIGGDFHQATEAEALAQGILGETEDHKEAVRAFAEKRTPVFQGR